MYLYVPGAASPRYLYVPRAVSPMDIFVAGAASPRFLSLQDEDNEYNGPQQIWHNWTDFYGFNSVLDSRSMY